MTDVKETNERHEKEGTTDSPGYNQMMGIFYEKHVCKTCWPKAMEAAFAVMMIGPLEFAVASTPRSRSYLDQIRTIATPTLLSSPMVSWMKRSHFFRRISHMG
ncbi:uncharacterized protein HD556DRAFT_1314628 [Suillus plorans]|uniref:Uncharacterized protein n=1 Tax=Suillus plorans TaxID=116603 RepID=A0A9P7ABE5_9AGAM|nr:uncharacterized protein HD556DRAFT_1314628 [Suillus plorans]KAG1784961.1 hypothetical protein HD556DRAFT_1314628 [Suillus plorans]